MSDLHYDRFSGDDCATYDSGYEPPHHGRDDDTSLPFDPPAGGLNRFVRTIEATAHI